MVLAFWCIRACRHDPRLWLAAGRLDLFFDHAVVNFLEVMAVVNFLLVKGKHSRRRCERKTVRFFRGLFQYKQHRASMSFCRAGPTFPSFSQWRSAMSRRTCFWGLRLRRRLRRIASSKRSWCAMARAARQPTDRAARFDLDGPFSSAGAE